MENIKFEMAKLATCSTPENLAESFKNKKFVLKQFRVKLKRIKETASSTTNNTSFKIRPFQIKLCRIKIPLKEIGVTNEYSENCKKNSIHNKKDNSISPQNNIENKSKYNLPLSENSKNNSILTHQNIDKTSTSVIFKNKENKYKKIFRSRKTARPSQVFNFSQESIEDNDPAADIIKKLIKEKRVRVATNAKGRGRPKLKRITVKDRKKIYNNKLDEINKQIPTIPEKSVFPNEFAVDLDITPREFQYENHQCDSPPVASQTPKRLDNSIMFHKPIKTYSPIKKMTHNHLIQAVQRIVSTPLNDKHIPSHSTTIANISEISLPETIMEVDSTTPKPWRLEEKSIPGTFLVNSTNSISDKSDKSITPIKNVTLSTNSIAGRDSVLNDSNAENIAPPINWDVSRPQGERLLSLRQQENPLIGRTHRSPLKTINILEVINLPPWKPIDKSHTDSTNTIKSKKNSRNMLGLKEFTNKYENSMEAFHNEINTEEHHNKMEQSNLFGFEEFIDSDENITTNIINKTSNNSSFNMTMKDKLKRLKRLRPKEMNRNSCKSKASQKTAVNLFDVKSNQQKEQQRINEMFCSTMINPNAVRIGKELAQNKRDTLDLFKDIENAEETTFTEDEPHRTYIKPYKRKRKVRQNLVMFWDSDESGDEEVANNEDDQVMHKHKYQRKEPKTNPEIEEFAKKFNDMCKEIDSTKLIIEQVS